MSASFTDLLRRFASVPPSADSDATLLHRYVHFRDENAFAALVARHGPLVFGVCRRVLFDAHAAEDAFQATFLILARRAGNIHRPDKLTAWLYGVAYRVAREARRSVTRRPITKLEETTAPSPACADPLADITARELLAVLEEEIQRLPANYRLPVVLCCLECLSQEEAASRLGWSAGQLKGRLERGRKQLHERLSRRGLVPVVALGLATSLNTAGEVSAALANTTVQMAKSFALGPAPDAGSPVHFLAAGVLRTMQVAKLRTIAAIVVLSVVALGATLLAASSGAPGTQAKGTAKHAPKGDPAEPNEKPESPKDAPGKDTLPAELNELQGLWQDHMGGMEHTDGEEIVRQPVVNGKCFFIRGDRLIWLTEDGRPSGKEEQITLDVKADPKRIALTPVLIDGKAVAARATVGIFELTKTGPRIHLGLDGSTPKRFLEPRKPVKGVDGREWLISRKKLGGD
jgi:RNA polymerase sigma factor (sigma-70 family)